MRSDGPIVRRIARYAAAGAVVACIGCGGDAAKPAAPPGAAKPAAGGTVGNVAKSPQPAGKEPRPRGDVASVRQAASVFEFVPATIDLGVLEPNEERIFDFEVFNRSKEPFHIRSVGTGCKCLTLDFDREMIDPGKSGKVRARVHATFDGIRRTIATVQLSDPARSSGSIEYRYALVPEVMAKPRKIEFGRVDAGVESEQSVQLTIQLPDDIPDPQLEPFVQHELPITLSIDPPTVTKTRPGMRDLVTRLRAKIKSDEAIPAFETAIILQAKAPRTFRTLSIQVTGQVAPAWHFERSALSFGVVRVGEEVARTIRFRWPGDTPPEVKELRSDTPEITVTQAVDAANHCFVVTVTCLAAKPARIDGRVVLVTNLSNEPSTLRVTARAR